MGKRCLLREVTKSLELSRCSHCHNCGYSNVSKSQRMIQVKFHRGSWFSLWQNMIFHGYQCRPVHAVLHPTQTFATVSAICHRSLNYVRVRHRLDLLRECYGFIHLNKCDISDLKDIGLVLSRLRETLWTYINVNKWLRLAKLDLHREEFILISGLGFKFE
jgi:hypothetical protein